LSLLVNNRLPNWRQRERGEEGREVRESERLKGGDRQRGKKEGREKDSTGFVCTFSIAVVFGVCLMF
jgi:hypothetical protein